jgi:hypothetical protein
VCQIGPCCCGQVQDSWSWYRGLDRRNTSLRSLFQEMRASVFFVCYMAVKHRKAALHSPRMASQHRIGNDGPERRSQGACLGAPRYLSSLSTLTRDKAACLPHGGGGSRSAAECDEPEYGKRGEGFLKRPRRGRVKYRVAQDRVGQTELDCTKPHSPV